MVAAVDAELPSDIGVGALLDVLDVGPVYSDWDIMLGLAGDRAGMAADTLPVVYHEAVIDHGPPSMRADRPFRQMSLLQTITV